MGRQKQSVIIILLLLLFVMSRSAAGAMVAYIDYASSWLS